MEKFMMDLNEIKIPDGLSVDFTIRETNPCLRIDFIKPIILCDKNYVLGNYDAYILAVARGHKKVWCTRRRKTSLSLPPIQRNDHLFLSKTNQGPQNRRISTLHHGRRKGPRTT